MTRCGKGRGFLFADFCRFALSSPREGCPRLVKELQLRTTALLIPGSVYQVQLSVSGNLIFYVPFNIKIIIIFTHKSAP